MFKRIGFKIKDFLAGRPSKRSGKWPEVRATHLKEEPKCAWCGGTAKLEVHHMLPFHLDPTKELDPNNLITLCEVAGSNCHFDIGHGGSSWKDYNPNVKQDCISHFRPKPDEIVKDS